MRCKPISKGKMNSTNKILGRDHQDRKSDLKGLKNMANSRPTSKQLENVILT